ncbi:MAG: 23S rRNA (adenine(2503)-C(2))-methyltransferase RlmN [Armatimonadetes bacterium]|nr:23S rRNA (adenine(2503)-C(2))-methyltransferase RlmN [Candidatus Hippobium faecium]
MNKKHLSSLTKNDLEKIFSERNIPKYRAGQITGAIYERFVSEFEKINIPKDLIEIMNDSFSTDILPIETKSSSPDGTCKYLLGLDDGNCIECVYLPYRDRKSVCISTQVGCPIGCVFCASGAKGFIRNLNVWEIMGQILTVQNDIKEKITHVVFMGIGEPLLNLTNTVRAIKLINTNLGISQRRITVSTSGITAKIAELSNYNLDITLALSLHSPFQDERVSLIPSAAHNTLPNLLSACDEYSAKTKRRITWEYILLENINCDEIHAKTLAKLAKQHKAHLNLIPCNKTDRKEFLPPSEKNIRRFTEILTKYNINYTLREKKGNSESAACGQLRNRKSDFVKKD